MNFLVITLTKLSNSHPTITIIIVRFLLLHPPSPLSFIITLHLLLAILALICVESSPTEYPGICCYPHSSLLLQRSISQNHLSSAFYFFPFFFFFSKHLFCPSFPLLQVLSTWIAPHHFFINDRSSQHICSRAKSSSIAHYNISHSTFTQFIISQLICALSFMHASFLSSLCTFNAHVLLRCNIALCTQATYNLPFTWRENPFVASRGNISLNFFQSHSYSDRLTRPHKNMLLLRCFQFFNAPFVSYP